MKPRRDEPPACGASRTPSGIPLETFYPTSVPPEPPGEYPYTRGIHRDMYRGRLWTFRQYAGFGSVRATNERFRYLLEQGQTGLSVAFDLPTQIGHDSDDAIALGEVGKVGVPVSSVEDVEALFDGIPLESVSVSMTINSTAAMLLAFLVAAAKRRGVAPSRLRGTVQNDMLKEFISRHTHRFPVKASMKLVTDVFEYTWRELPHWNPISVSGYHMREAGSTAVQEVAFTLSNAIEYSLAAQARGIPAGHIARRISFFWNVHNHLLEEVAKLRAARRMWARIVRDRFGLTDPECARMRFHAQTAGSTLTSGEPENNAVRVTIQALAAVLGGAQSLHTNGIDEALGLPSETAARVALRTQQIIAYESGAADVADPLGGSSVIEALTDEIERRAEDLLHAIDGMGGALAAIEQGYQEAAIEEEAYRHQREVEAGERVVVGVNFFRSEAPPAPLEVLRIDPDLERERIREVRARKLARPPRQVEELQAKLEAEARAGRNTVESLVSAAEGGLTIGEMAATLSRVFGEHVE